MVSSVVNKTITAWLLGVMLILVSSGALAETAQEYVAKGIRELPQNNSLWPKRDYQKAIACFNQAIKVDQKNAGAYRQLGDVYGFMGDYTNAVKEYTHAIEADPSSADCYVDRAVARLMIGDIDAAVADYTQAITLNTTNALAYCGRGVAHEWKGDLEKAIADYSRAMELAPQYAEAFSNRGGLWLKKGEIEKGVGDIAQAMKLSPGYIRIYVDRGAIMDTQKDTGKALADLTQEIKNNPTNAEALFNRGIVYLQTRNVEKGLADHAQAIRLKPEYSEVYCNRGKALRYVWSKGYSHNDITASTNAIQDNPLNALAWYRRGCAYLHVGVCYHFKAAIADLTQAIKINPNLTEAYANRGYAHERDVSLSNALADYDRAVRINPNFAGVYSQSGEVYKRRGEWANAKDRFTRALALDPLNAVYCFNRGYAAYLGKDYDLAWADIQKAKQMGYAVPVKLMEDIGRDSGKDKGAKEAEQKSAHRRITSSKMIQDVPVIDIPVKHDDVMAEMGLSKDGGGPGSVVGRMFNAGGQPLFVDKLPYFDNPHQTWAKPYRAGKLKVLYINDTFNIGEAAMLEQRGDLDCYIYTVPVFLDWFGRWEENPEFTSYLEHRMRQLLAYEPDVIIANYVMGSRGGTSEASVTLPASIHNMVLERVAAGAGLIIIPSHETEWIPDAYDVISRASPLKYNRPRSGFDRGKGKFKGDHPIVDGVPMDLIEFGALNPFGNATDRLGQSEVTAGAETAVTINGLPLLVLGKYGKGRVAAWGYASQTSTPRSVPLYYTNQVDSLVQADNARLYEYEYSLLLRSILWAGQKEPVVRMQTGKLPVVKQGEVVSVPITLINPGKEKMQGTISATVRDSDYGNEKEVSTPVDVAPGQTNGVKLDLGAAFRDGLHMVDCILKNNQGRVENWGSAFFTVTNTVKVAVETDRQIYRRDETIKINVRVKPDGAAQLSLLTELWDTFGRLVGSLSTPVAEGQSEFSTDVEFPLAGTVAWVFDVKCSVLKGDQCLAQAKREVSIPRYPDKEEWINIVWPPGRYRSDHPIFHVFKALGIDVARSGGEGYMGVNARANFGQEVRLMYTMGSYAKTPTDDQRNYIALDANGELIRDTWEKKIKADAVEVAKYGGVHFALSHEQACEYDSCYHPNTIRGFKNYLQKKYKDVAALNAEWGTDFKDWDMVKPIKTEEWKKKNTGNFSQWLEFRRFNDSIRTDLFVMLADLWRKELGHPVRVGHEYTFGLWQHTIPYGAYDYYGFLSKGLDSYSPYGGAVVETLASDCHTGTEWLLLTSWCKGTLYAAHGSWPALFNGACGADWYESSHFLAGYMALTPNGASIFDATDEIKKGIGKALLTAERRRDPVAIWQDMSNEYAAWLLGNTMTFSRYDIFKALQGHAIQPLAISDEQVENGYLLKNGIKLLYLPHIVCVSEKAGNEVKKFVEAGGVAVADCGVGMYDGLGRPLASGSVNEVFGIKREGLMKKGSADQAVMKETDNRFPMISAGIPLSQYDPCYDESVSLTTGKALGAVGKKNTPVFIVNEVGKGRAMLLNFFPGEYMKSRGTNAVFDLAGAMLKAADVNPEAQVFTGDQPARFYNLNRFKRESAWYVGVFRYSDCTNGPDTAVVRMPVKGHIYEMRSHKYFGVNDRVTDSFKPGETSIQSAKLYAVLPYEVKGMKLNVKKGAKRGATLDYSLSVKGADGSADHVIRVEVRNPEKQLTGYYGGNVLALRGEFKGTMRLALNDPPGEWEIRAVDVISGKDAVSLFQLE